jgi:hypothetical protein
MRWKACRRKTKHNMRARECALQPPITGRQVSAVTGLTFLVRCYSYATDHSSLARWILLFCSLFCYDSNEFFTLPGMIAPHTQSTHSALQLLD